MEGARKILAPGRFNSREVIKDQKSPIKRPAAIFVLFVPRTRIFLAKAVNMVLESSWYSGGGGGGYAYERGGDARRKF